MVSMTKADPTRTWHGTAAASLGLASALAGTAAIAGWLGGVRELTSFGGVSPLAPGAALALIILGLGVFRVGVREPARHWEVRWSALVVAALSGYMYATAWEGSAFDPVNWLLAIDDPELARDWAEGVTFTAGPMVLLALALASLTFTGRYRIWWTVAEVLAYAGASIGALFALAHLYGVPLIEGAERTPVALPGALGLVLLGAAVAYRCSESRALDRLDAAAALLAAKEGLEAEVQRRTAELSASAASLAESEREHRTLLANLPGMAYRCALDDSWTMSFVSEGCADLTGHAPADLIANSKLAFADLIHPDDRELVRRGVEEALAAKRPFQIEYRIRTASGAERWVWERGQGVRPETGGATHLEGLIIDVTRERRAAAELSRLNQELERRVAARTGQLEAVNEELEAFVYSVSHDLRAPLRAISGFARELRERLGERLAPDASEDLQRILAASGRMGALIEGLLMLSRITREEMRVEQVDLSRLAGEVVAAIREEQPGRVVEVSIQAGLGDWGEPKMLRAMLHNLFENAWKFTAARDPGRVEFSATTTSRGRVYRVADNGVGFDAEEAGRLFDAFQRGRAEDRYEGHGIGLAIVRRVVHRHGGRVWAEGAPDRGATLYFTLGGAGIQA
jgi:PAS domain S-box-containing protein